MAAEGGRKTNQGVVSSSNYNIPRTTLNGRKQCVLEKEKKYVFLAALLQPIRTMHALHLDQTNSYLGVRHGPGGRVECPYLAPWYGLACWNMELSQEWWRQTF